MTADTGLAVVTGASTGIGRALAREFVEHGYDVVMAADEDLIHEAADELSRSGRAVTPVQVDLATVEGVEELWRQVESVGQPVAAAALNVGVGVPGRFAATSLEDHLRLVDLNVRSTVHLGKLVVDRMVVRGAGRILVTSSMVSVAPNPYFATYAASKAFVHSFAEAIRFELKGTGITVTSLMPGPTDTAFFRRAGMEDTLVGRGPKDDAQKVARDGFEAMLKGKPHVRAGSFLNAVATEALTHLPDRVSSLVLSRQAKRPQD
jgi:uncharacterized protein